MRKIIFIFLISIFLNCSSDIQKNFISLFVITEELEIGDNRVVLTALDENGNTLTNDLRFFLRKLDRNETIEINMLVISAIILSFLFSFLTVKFFLDYIKKFSLNIFVIYRIIVALILFYIIYF